MKNSPEFKNTIEFDVVKNSIEKLIGMKGSYVHVLQSTHMLWLNMYQIYPQAEILLSDKIVGPNTRTIMRASARIDVDNRE